MLGRVWCVLPLNSGWNQCFRRHSTRESPYGRHTTRRLIRGVSGLQLVALERLPSIEGTLEIQMDVTFLRGTKAPLVKGSRWPEGPEGLARRSEKLPFQGSWQPKAD